MWLLFRIVGGPGYHLPTYRLEERKKQQARKSIGPIPMGPVSTEVWWLGQKTMARPYISHPNNEPRYQRNPQEEVNSVAVWQREEKWKALMERPKAHEFYTCSACNEDSLAELQSKTSYSSVRAQCNVSLLGIALGQRHQKTASVTVTAGLSEQKWKKEFKMWRMRMVTRPRRKRQCGTGGDTSNNQ